MRERMEKMGRSKAQIRNHTEQLGGFESVMLRTRQTVGNRMIFITQFYFYILNTLVPKTIVIFFHDSKCSLLKMISQDKNLSIRTTVILRKMGLGQHSKTWSMELKRSKSNKKTVAHINT